MRYSLAIAYLLLACFIGRAEVDVFKAHKNARALVLIFISNECPIANRYAPEIQRLHKQFSTNQIAFFVVHSDPSETLDSIQKHGRDFGYTCEVLRDADQRLARLAGATVTPEAAVFLPDGQRVYRGRIDNRYKDFGKARPKPTRHDLQEVLEAIVRGKTPPVSQTRAIGCYIPGLK